MSVKCQVKVTSQSELDIGGRVLFAAISLGSSCQLIFSQNFMVMFSIKIIAALFKLCHKPRSFCPFQGWKIHQGSGLYQMITSEWVF